MISIKPKGEHKETRGGFTILYAILIATVVLTIGLSLLGVLVQEVALSGAEKESGMSFYTSDSGMECALYWDINGDSFRTGGPITCDGNSPLPPGVIMTSVALGPPTLVKETYAFKAMFPNGCADVKVMKIVDTLTNSVSMTTIQSRGYNTVCPPTASTKPWRLERGLETDY